MQQTTASVVVPLRKAYNLDMQIRCIVVTPCNSVTCAWRVLMLSHKVGGNTVCCGLSQQPKAPLQCHLAMQGTTPDSVLHGITIATAKSAAYDLPIYHHTFQATCADNAYHQHSYKPKEGAASQCAQATSCLSVWAAAAAEAEELQHT